MNLKIILTTVFSIIILFGVNGQKIDSLRSLLKQKNGAERADVLFELARQYIRSDQDSAAACSGLEGYKIAINLNDSLRIVKTGRATASALRYLGKVDSAMVLYQKILPMSQKLKNSFEYVNILSGMGLAYNFKAEYDKALRFFFQELEQEKIRNDEGGIAITLNNIGIVYYKLKNYKKGRALFEETIALKKKLNDKYDLDIAYINLGLCYAYLGDFIPARSNILQGIKVCGDHCKDYVIESADFALGVVSFGLKQYGDAETYFLRSYAMSKKTHNIRYQFDNIDYLTQIYLHQNRIKDAAQYLRTAEVLINAGAPYNLEVIKIYSRFIELYSRTGDYKKATFYQQKYIQVKDSVYSEELTNKLMKVETEYLERENNAKIASQAQILHLKEAVINRQQLLIVFACCMTVMLALLAVLLIRSNRRKKAINKILDERVRDRTRQLEQKQEALLHAHRENKILVERASYNMRSSLASIKGLCTTGVHDLGDPNARQYMVQVNMLSDHLESEVQRFQNAFSDVAVGRS
ncbi:tetratricopeptide repeat protein [Fulvivirgaceae bacterium PWU4]|uniref:Tetratricopeptide repeat protein n=1 Tax=Chryseosolibacter histidini TaxID=2782349 RepID=A0AAP2DQ75_9BACT|nr:tetratricopeptide repeat protein [Chryseosolibacter histidini]MBT1699343.1 tetratricopeptide repeat protein [Chryseosolibacter histidini]